MSIVDRAQHKIEDGLNAKGRSTGHVALGTAICVAFVGATAAIAATRPQPVAPGARPSKHPAHSASYVDPKAAKLVAPTGFVGLSALVAKPADQA